MTLTEQELQVQGTTVNNNSSPELKLSRRPSKEEWKGCKIQHLLINVLPKILIEEGAEMIVE